METYIAVLRGINVGGHNKIKMADLRSHLKEIGLKNVRTYIQSGNIGFEYNKTETGTLAEMIHNAIASNYGYDIPVIVMGKETLKRIIRENPFPDREDVDESKLHVVFLSNQTTREGIKAADAFDHSPDEMIAGRSEVYLHCPNGFARTKYKNPFFEKHFGGIATTRNWKTTLKLLDLAENDS